MSLKFQSLEELWRRIDLGTAEEQEKIDGAVLAGESHDSAFVPRLLSLLTDQSGQARYYALQSLVLDLKQKDDEVRDLCWNLLGKDSDEDVRAMAATCLGSIYLGTRSANAFHQLVRELKDPHQPSSVKGSLYTALFKVAGRPPLEWPGLQSPWKTFKESGIDWDKVAWLEDQLCTPDI
jgi:hypothetical protein